MTELSDLVPHLHAQRMLRMRDMICGPVFVSPSQTLQQVLGDDIVFEGNEQATDCLGLMMQHRNWIAEELQRTLAELHVYLPRLLEDDTGVAHSNDWAHGFKRGLQAYPGTWNDLLDSEDEGGVLVPMMDAVKWPSIASWFMAKASYRTNVGVHVSSVRHRNRAGAREPYATGHSTVSADGWLANVSVRPRWPAAPTHSCRPSVR